MNLYIILFLLAPWSAFRHDTVPISFWQEKFRYFRSNLIQNLYFTNALKDAEMFCLRIEHNSSLANFGNCWRLAHKQLRYACACHFLWQCYCTIVGCTQRENCGYNSDCINGTCSCKDGFFSINVDDKNCVDGKANIMNNKDNLVMLVCSQSNYGKWSLWFCVSNSPKTLFSQICSLYRWSEIIQKHEKNS